MARRILNRKELRADYDAAESRKRDEDEVEGEEDEAEDETEDEEEGEEGDEEAGDGEEEEEEAPVVKKKKPTRAKPRTRTPKVTRMRAIWAVFNNSNQRVATFDYPKRKEAHDLAAKLSADKKTTHFVQMVKEPWEEKKE
jgi:hypothetical protein